jgi:predicted nucleotide-binding protein
VANGLTPDNAQAVVVLLTPDDIVTLHPDLRGPKEPRDETAQVMQARPNVLIELGMALSAFRDKTVIVELGQLRRIADLDGLNVIRFNGSAESISKLVGRLGQAGCPVDTSGTDWLSPLRFANLEAYDRTPPED